MQRLHALDIATGAERPNSPVIITATYAGSGAGSVGGVITFDPIGLRDIWAAACRFDPNWRRQCGVLF